MAELTLEDRVIQLEANLGVMRNELNLVQNKASKNEGELRTLKRKVAEGPDPRLWGDNGGR